MVATERLVSWLAPSLVHGALSEGLAAGLRGLVLDGRLLSGTRLPAERELAAALGLARATVSHSYDRLRSEGYLVSRQGAGTVVRLPAPRFDRPDEGAVSGPDVIDLTVAALPAPSVLTQAAAAALDGLSGQVAGNGMHPLGLPALRSAVAARYTARGLPTTVEQVLICSGALHGWNLLLRTLSRPGAPVVVEQPTYPAVLDAALAHHVRVHPLPVDPGGWDLSQLATPARAPVLAHLTLDGQNPTGLWADDPSRRRLFAALHPETVVVVDETLTDLPHGAPVTRPGPALARRGTTVVALGSMSKSFWAGLRVGWIRGPAELIRRLAAARSSDNLATSVFDQLLSVQLLGLADQVLPDRRAMLAGRRDVLLDALATYAPGWSATSPQGGLSLWVDLGGVSSTRLAQRAREFGVRITPGPRFTVTGTHDRWTRLPFALPQDRLSEAVRLLATAAATDAGGAVSRRRGGPETAWTA